MAAESSILDLAEPAEKLLEGHERVEAVKHAHLDEISRINAHWEPLFPASRVAIMAVVDDYGDLVPIPSASELLWELKARWRVSPD